MTEVPATLLAQRRFTAADQERFAAFSGDRNPLHLNALAARRTQAGAPVVHGIHLLLWCLDSAARELPDPTALATLRVRFEDFVYVGDSVEAVLLQQRTPGLRIDLRSRGLVVVRLSGTFGPPRPDPEQQAEAAVALRPAAPLEIPFDQVNGRSGEFTFSAAARQAVKLFPDLARLLGASRIAALAATSYLVGMVCPGLYSVFGGITIEICEEQSPTDTLRFRVSKTDPRFRSAHMQITGGGISGSIESFVRLPPIAQASMHEIAVRVLPHEFADAEALVIGGSRGLGELTAKMLAAGGARVTVTYASGESDAQRVKNEIADAGGCCEILKYDVRLAAAPQLDAFSVFDSVYYFATPLIFKKRSGLFDKALFDEFCAFYLSGFADLIGSLVQRQPKGLAVFQPSSVAVTEPASGLTEYAMAKSAAEALCAHIAATRGSVAIVARRLPRLLTDQTASLTEIETADPIREMLPIVREVHSKRPRASGSGTNTG